jgi:hypothetical protein
VFGRFQNVFLKAVFGQELCIPFKLDKCLLWREVKKQQQNKNKILPN